MSSPPPHEIITVPAQGSPGRDELRQQCYDVRIAVFHREQGFPLETEIDDLDEGGTHILLRLVPSLRPIGTIRLTKASTKTGSGAGSGGHDCYYKLSRLAVLKDFRQYRFGRALVLSLHAHVIADAKASGLRATDTVQVIAHSQLPVKGFYGKFGYVPEGDEFDEDGAPHQKMVARLSLSD